jgi:hypothetical protein
MLHVQDSPPRARILSYVIRVDAAVIVGVASIGLKFNNEFDLTAIGTLSLAVVTLLYVLFARRSLKQTQAQIGLGQAQLKQTQEEITLSRREAEEAHRPVVIPVTGGQHVTLTSGRKLPAGPYVPETGLLVVPIMNIGLGPALYLEWTIEPLDVWNGRTDAPSAPQPLGEVTGIGVAGVTRLEVVIHHLEEVPDFKLTLTYGDMAGKQWRTFASWIADRGRYDGLAIGCGPKRRDPLVEAVQPFRPSGARPVLTGNGR